MIERLLPGVPGVQTLVPPTLLNGLLPSALLEEYEFWQEHDDGLKGYQHPHVQRVCRRFSLLVVTLEREGDPDMTGFGNAVASATVRRIPLLPPPALPVAAAHGPPLRHTDCVPDPAQPELQLLNLLHPRPGTALATLAALLMRMDNLSHCLVWAAGPPGQECVEVVEIPRIRLTFRRKADDGSVQGIASPCAALRNPPQPSATLYSTVQHSTTLRNAPPPFRTLCNHHNTLQRSIALCDTQQTLA